MIFICLSIFFTGLIYAALLVYCLCGWKKLPAFEAAKLIQTDATFSIIIPARNEENNIINCLSDIINQDYDINKFEIIVVDDFSEDDTLKIANEFQKAQLEYKIHILSLEKMLLPGVYNSYKKIAIAQGILHSNNKWIITTDADCRREKNWLITIADFIRQNKNAQLISAPVRFSYNNNFLEKAQSLEFAGLIGIGAACMAQKTPNMCNGANLIYRKSAYEEVNGFTGIDTLASGDDEFLMHKIAKKWPDGICFIKSFDTVVTTPATTGITAFLQQRKRWASKSGKYQNKKIIFLLVSTYIFYILLIISCLLSFFDFRYFYIFLSALILKILPEGIFLYKITGFLQQRNLMKYYFPAILFQVLYVIFIGFYANFGKYNWKGRKVQ